MADMASLTANTSPEVIKKCMECKKPQPRNALIKCWKCKNNICPRDPCSYQLRAVERYCKTCTTSFYVNNIKNKK